MYDLDHHYFFSFEHVCRHLPQRGLDHSIHFHPLCSVRDLYDDFDCGSLF